MNSVYVHFTNRQIDETASERDRLREREKQNEKNK